jgi:hypothetical protein
MIRPGSWKSEGRGLTYYAPGRILVVCQTEDVHKEVGVFLAEMGRAAPVTRGKPAVPGRLAAPALAAAAGTPVQPAQHFVPAPPRLADPQDRDNRPAASPRHLFHIILEGLDVGGGESVKLKNFTLRYEGEGIIDSNIVNLLTGLHKAGALSDLQSGMTLPGGTYLEKTPHAEPCPPLTPPPLPSVNMGTTPALPVSHPQFPSSPSVPGAATPAPPPPPGFPGKTPVMPPAQ